MGRSSVQVGSNAGVQFNPEWLKFASTTTPFEPKSDTGISRQELQIIVSLLDLTALESGACTSDFSQLFDDAVRPLPAIKMHVAGACTFPVFLSMAGTWLRDAGVRTVAVAGGFPHALSDPACRIEEVAGAALLADEVDFPIPRYLALEERWEDLYRDIRALVDAAGGTPAKVILGSGELVRPELIYRAAMTAMMAGASFIKTSTGRERINARLDAGAVICGAIRDYTQSTGFAVGFKPAGGIRTPAEAISWIQLVRERLGEQWVTPDRMRIGASGLLSAIRAAWEGEDRPMGPIVY